MNRQSLLTFLALLVAVFFAGAWFRAWSGARIHEQDAKLVVEAERHVANAQVANKELTLALERADALQEQANQAKAAADAQRTKATALARALKKAQRPKTLAECTAQLEGCARDCDAHVARLNNAFDLQKATALALRESLAQSQKETSEERAARRIEHSRAEKWKKKAANGRRQKILIGVGAGLGGIALTYAATRAVTGGN